MRRVRQSWEQERRTGGGTVVGAGAAKATRDTAIRKLADAVSISTGSARWHQGISAQERIAIQGLEQADTVISDVANFRDVVPRELPLNSKRPLLGIRRMEVRRGNRA